MRRSDPWQQQAAELSLGSMFVKIKTLSQGHTALDWLAWDNQIRITARYQAYNLWEDIFKFNQAFPRQHYQHHDMTIRQTRAVLAQVLTQRRGENQENPGRHNLRH